MYPITAKLNHQVAEHEKYSKLSLNNVSILEASKQKLKGKIKLNKFSIIRITSTSKKNLIISPISNLTQAGHRCIFIAIKMILVSLMFRKKIKNKKLRSHSFQ